MIRNRPVLVIGALIVATLVIVAELLIFPNLHTNPGILILALLTPMLVALTGAFWLARQRTQFIGIGLTSALTVVIILDGIVFAGPLFAPARHANDANVFATSTPAPQATIAQATATPTPIVLRGAFDNKPDPVHHVRGTAILGKAADNSVVLRFEDFLSSDGPDVYVFLSRDVVPTTPTQVMNGIEVSRLQATEGNLNFTLPANLDYAQFHSVVVYCKAFTVIFGYASLAA